jgi:hypothetical protein
LQVRQRDRLKDVADRPQLHGRRADHAPAGVAGVDDAPGPVDLDRDGQPIRESEAIGVAQRLQVVDRVGRRLIVVGDARVEGQASHPFDGLGGDPGN